MATRNVIEDGPSKFDLMNALLDGDCKNRRTITFCINDGGVAVSQGVVQGAHYTSTEPIIINVLGREDGSGNNWLFEGWMEKNSFHGKDDHARSRPVNGFYSTKTRKGWIEYDKPSRMTRT